MERYTKDIISKIGNAMIYIANNVNFINKTKLLKLLYLLEECSIARHKTPFFGIDFKVWKFGPVAQEIYIDLSNDDTEIFSEYIATSKKGKSTSICPKKDFSDDEFSDNDIDTLNYIVGKFGNLSAEELVTFTHDLTLWKIVVRENDLEQHFVNANSSDHKIDFSRLLNDHEKDLYNEVVENKVIFNQLKY